MKKNVSIVIIHYKAVEHLRKCLTQLHSDASPYDITVVDNHSEQDLKQLKKSFPQVNWIMNDRNRGFSSAANQGVLAAKGRWILFLNPDVRLSRAEVDELFHFAEKERLDAVSPSFTDERYQKSLPTFHSLLSEFTPLHTVSRAVTLQKTLVGGCVLVRKVVLEQIGGWDERFFLWFEDSDLTQSLLNHGFKVGFAPFTIHHVGGASVNTLKEHLQHRIFFQSMDIYIRKYFSPWQQQILRKSVIERFSSHRGYPVMNTGSTWVVPNMKKELLHDFLMTNEHFFLGRELIIVSSQFSWQLIWKLRAQYPSVRFIPLSSNSGFSSTVNIGLRVSTTEATGTVNDDVILNSSCLDNLEQAFQPEMGSLNPVIYSMSEHVESAGVDVLPKGKAVPRTQLPKTKLAVVPATNAACVLYNSVALEEVGLFDEKFGSYLEDIDLSLRLRRKGFFNVIVRDARVIHAKHATSKQFGKYKQYLDLKNWWLVILKNWSITEFLQHSPGILLERLRNLSGLIKS